ncbi:family 2 encapsulin nanocompartment cargo protein terpene cyclase [Streptomyces spectabilis]|uniref:Terpene synthase n=1 Tax=Streptomyces spectabilis TaxID=68270 RepID=A0A516R0L0_STRST|nr:family 2 encapsulin nanocompartment cargo protein terpene cyclase [Streptomyces spectabilis]QDQ09193.1 Camphene synthase [Streptomyces spectabilis]
MAPLPTGPTGLGTAAARLLPRRPPSATATVPDLHIPDLHTCGPLRDDPALGEEVDDRLLAWAAGIGIYPGRLEHVRAARFGRLMMLCHPDTDDVERLLAPARCTLAAWALDDHYCDDADLGAAPHLLGSRLAVAAATLDGLRLPGPCAARFEDAVHHDPVLEAVRSAVGQLARVARPTQLTRARHAMASLFAALAQEATWRATSRTPAVWEYLVNRQANSFRPCLTVIDAVGGYQLGDDLWSDPRLQHAVTTATLASSLLNDLYSVHREAHGAQADFNLPLAVAAEEGCSLQEAVDRSAALHNELMHRYEAQAATLALGGPPELHRYLAGISAWCGGNHAWHRDNPRYAPDEGSRP